MNNTPNWCTKKGVSKGAKVDIFAFELTKKAEKQVEQLPAYIVLKLAAWIEDVGSDGINEVRKIPGYHDEPLKGERKGE